MNESNEKLTDEQAIVLLREAMDERDEAREQYRVASRRFMESVAGVLTRIREERGMTFRQMERLVPRPGGGRYTFQYLNQVAKGQPPSDAMVKALIRGLGGGAG